MSTPIIRTEGLTRRFGDFTAVDGLSITVSPGSIFAFLGANGSGKSTTIRMLIGLLKPTAGRILLDGVDVVREPRTVRDRIGYMGQKVSLYHGLTLRENAEFYGGLYGIADADLRRRWQALGERFGLTEADGERPESLPAGIRQRAGLALATLHEPRVLFLDEPTAGVDVESRGLFWDVIQDEAARGTTVFVTTHFLEEVDYCDWVSFIDAGHLVADAPPETLRTRFSDGYVATITTPDADRQHLLRLMTEAGLAPIRSDGALVLTLPTLDDAALAVLARITDVAPHATVHLDQPAMTDVFGRVLAEASR